MKKESTPNALINEGSPYLLQHAYNPVNWFPWSDTAFHKARELDRLILVSIGYSACHWCHVMERECFEDEEVAALMNRYFVNIKVDREERPDVDQIYMSAVQLMNNGRGGWPLNCFALPDGKPIYGGTYFPKPNWIKLLHYLADFWSKNREKALEFGHQVCEAVQQFEFVSATATSTQSLTLEDLARIYIPWSQSFDMIEGGTDHAPKFPLPVCWKFMLHYAMLSKETKANEAVQLTLNKMARGGIYDQIGGGFARYSTDRFWFVPHFEKMLYDNAQLIELYSEAWQYYQHPLYQETVEETVECLLRDFRHPRGGFFSAYDADSEGEEGKYYVWTAEEIRQVLAGEAELILEYYSIKPDGNWESGKNIPFRSKSDDEFAKEHRMSVEEWLNKRNQLRNQLLQARARRIAPGLDDKVLSSWNGLAIKALFKASVAFGRADWQDAAIEALNFILINLTDDGRLLRSWKNGRGYINGFADDYAFVIEALLEAYRSTFDPIWAKLAKNFMDYAIQHFSHDPSGLFYFTSDLDPALIARKQELYDNVIPSANASLAHSLKTLGWLFEQDSYLHRSRQMLDNVLEQVKSHGASYACWADLALRFVISEPEIVFTGPRALTLRNELAAHPMLMQLSAGCLVESTELPVLAQRWKNEESCVYVCRDSTCELPTTDLERVAKLISFPR
jgi:uncharacterized protein YyaL (SSP411 family)